MTTQELNFLIPPYGTASLQLPELLTPDAFIRLEAAVRAALGEPGPAPGATPATDPGRVEFDSWSASLN